MTNKIKLGFVPLTDSAPLITASKKAYFSDLGLQVELKAQNSWATLRDKLQSGALDAAQILAPMPIASTLGLDGARVPMKVPLILSQNGNAITLSNQLINEIMLTNKLDELPFPMPASLLRSVVKKRQKKQRPTLKFASVFPFSCHQYQLNDWLESAQLLREVDIITLPPSAMANSLESQVIDGFCVGGPWNAKSVREQKGTTVITSADIWQNKTEKVLAFTQDYYEQNKEVVSLLVNALLKACLWLKPTINRFEAAKWLQESGFINEPLHVIAPSLLGSCLVQEHLSPRCVENYNRFNGEDDEQVNRPLKQGQDWLLGKMLASKQLSASMYEANKDKLCVFDSSILDSQLKANGT